MKELDFYKYCDDEINNLHYWETMVHCGLQRAEKVKEELELKFINAEIKLIDTSENWYMINVKFFSIEDSDLFLLMVS